MTDYTIGKASREDIPFLWEMLYQSLFVPAGHKPFCRDILKEPSISKYVDGWGVSSGDMAFIARLANGKPIGAVTARLFSKNNKGYGYVDAKTPEIGMAVLPEYRGMGIGTKLLETMIEELRHQGVSAVSLSVNPDNPAIHLYKRFGFIEIGSVGTSVTMKLII